MTENEGKTGMKNVKLVESLIEAAVLCVVFLCLEPIFKERHVWLSVALAASLLLAALVLSKMKRNWLRRSIPVAITIAMSLLVMWSDSDSHDLLKSGVSLVTDNEANVVLDITLRNLSEEPIVVTSARVQVDDILLIQPCSGVPVSALTPTGSYDLAIPFARGEVSRQLAQSVSPKSTDRFQLTLAPINPEALYRITVRLLYNESKMTQPLGSFVLFIDDRLVPDIPDSSKEIAPDALVQCLKSSLQRDGASSSLFANCNRVYLCIDENVKHAVNFFRADGERSSEAADLERRARSYIRSGLTDGGSNETSDAFPEATSPTAAVASSTNETIDAPGSKVIQFDKPKYRLEWDVSLFIGHPSPNNEHICRGMFVDPDRILTDQHCLVNRRSGGLRASSEFIIQHARDLSEHIVVEVVASDEHWDLALLRVSPPLHIDGPTARERL